MSDKQQRANERGQRQVHLMNQEINRLLRVGIQQFLGREVRWPVGETVMVGEVVGIGLNGQGVVLAVTLGGDIPREPQLYHAHQLEFLT